MPISEYLSEKWDRRLYNWRLWLRPTGGSQGPSEGVSSIYDPANWQRGTARSSSGHSVLSGEARDTDRLMVQINETDARMYRALVAWIDNDGSRGDQSCRLAVHQDTYRDIVDSGKRELERLSRRTRPRQKIECPRVSPEQAYD